MSLKKLIYLLTKDTGIFLRDIRSFMLLFLTPIFIVILVGVAFLSTQPSNVPIIICGESRSGLYNDTAFVMKNSGVFDVREYEGNCDEVISQNIKNSMVRAGIIIPPEGLNMTVRILIDNTKPVSAYIQSYFNLITKDLSQKLINAMIGDMWSNTQNISGEIDKTHAELVSSAATLNSVAAELDTKKSEVEDAARRLSAVELAKVNVETSLLTLQGIKNSAVSISSNINSVDQRMQAVSSSVYSMNLSPPLQAMIIDNITAAQNSLMLARSGVNDLEWNINRTKTNLEGSEKILDDADVGTLGPKLNGIATSLSQSSSSVRKIRDDINALADNLLAAKGLITDSMQKYKPEYSEPVNSEIAWYFGNKRYIDFVFPTILVMILMLMSTFLASTSFIRQRSTGLLKRISISPTGMNFLLLERMMLNAIISLIPLPFILAAGVLVLGIRINISNVVPIIFICAILSLVFVLLGLIIASFSKTESTAILASLIIVIPMMFLSGTFTPYEAFPPLLKQVAVSMPITISARLIEGLTFYELPLPMMGMLVAYLFVYIVVAAIVARLVMKRGL